MIQIEPAIIYAVITALAGAVTCLWDYNRRQLKRYQVKTDASIVKLIKKIDKLESDLKDSIRKEGELKGENMLYEKILDEKFNDLEERLSKSNEITTL